MASDQHASPDLGHTLYAHAEALFPLLRSITGEGLRDTLHYIGQQIPLQLHEVPSGSQVLDWQVPPEWTLRHASITALDGRRILNVADHNLHILQYSQPIDRVMSREELEPHLFSLPEAPDLIPYRTAYYHDNFGFCLAHSQRLSMTDVAYHVRIDAQHAPGSLSYGECILPGSQTDEVLFSIHCCHPSLANDNLSAIAVAIGLAQHLATQPRRFTYRFLFAPGTIGAITWLARNRDAGTRVRHGLVLSCLGDTGAPSYKESRRGDAEIDRYVRHVLREEGHGDRVLPFSPYGYDERQYCSPGFNLPVGCLMRSPPGSFPEYHTSADNLSFIRPGALADSLRLLRRIVTLVEQDGIWLNTSPYGEPQLGRRNLYSAIGGTALGAASGLDTMTLLWVLNLTDGAHTLLDIAERAGKPFAEIVAAVDALQHAELLVRGSTADGTKLDKNEEKTSCAW